MVKTATQPTECGLCYSTNLDWRWRDVKEEPRKVLGGTIQRIGFYDLKCNNCGDWQDTIK